MAAYALPWPSARYTPAPVLIDPQPIGPWADLQAAKAAGQQPYVVRCRETGAIYDRILDRVFLSSEEYARVQGHQQHSHSAPAKRTCMREWAAIRTRCATAKPLAITRKVQKDEIVAAFSRFQRGDPGAENALLTLVWNFGKSKAYRRLSQRTESFLTADDVAQEVTHYAAKKLCEFKGNGANFYSLVNRATFTETSAAEIEAGKVEKRVPLVITDEDGNTSDNAELHGHTIRHNGRLRNHKAGYAYRRGIPDSVKGADRQIFGYIADGKTHEQIGSLLGMSKAAVESRVRRVRESLS